MLKEHFMKLLKLAVIPAALVATSAFAEEPVEVASSYDAEAGIVANTTSQLVDGTKTLFKTATHPGAVSVELGSLGYGANLAWSVNEKVELQAGWSGGDVDFVDTKVGTNSDSYVNWNKFLGNSLKGFSGDLKVEADLNNPYIGTQVRPFNNWLTIGSGIVFQDNSYNISLISDSDTSTFKKGSKTYTIPAGSGATISTEYKNDLAPYLTVGFRPNMDKKWGVYGEVGALYTGGVTAKAEAVNGSNITLPPNVSLDDFTKDMEQKVSDKMTKWYPVAKLGVTYRF